MYRTIVMMLIAALLSFPLTGCGGGGKKAEQKPEEAPAMEEGSGTMHEEEHPTEETGNGTEGEEQEHPGPSKTEGSGTQ
jgi:hypothetical protein